jgi:hypothetical protein
MILQVVFFPQVSAIKSYMHFYCLHTNDIWWKVQSTKILSYLGQCWLTEMQLCSLVWSKVRELENDTSWLFVTKST